MPDSTGNNQQHEVAEVGQAPSYPVGHPYVFGGGVVTAIFSGIAGLMWLRRRLSRDGLEVAKDNSERRLLSVITEERDRAVATAEAAWATRAEDARLIGQLTSEVKHLTETNRYLISDVSGLREEIGQLRDIIYSLLPPEIAERMRDVGATNSAGIRNALAETEGDIPP